jgi:hypothetical protein
MPTYSASDVRGRDFILRMLLVGPSRVGKTTTTMLTAPGPIFCFNTDGTGGLGPAADLGADFEGEDIDGSKAFEAAFARLKPQAHKYKTIVFDNLTIYSIAVEHEVLRENLGLGAWREYLRRLMNTVRSLANLPCHLVVIGHSDQKSQTANGGAFNGLYIAGKAKNALPTLLQDWIYLEAVGNDQAGGFKREFVLAPEGDWTKAARSVQGLNRMAGDIGKFIELAESGGHRKKKANGKIVRQPAPTDDGASGDAVSVAAAPARKAATWKPQAASRRWENIIMPETNGYANEGYTDFEENINWDHVDVPVPPGSYDVVCSSAEFRPTKPDAHGKQKPMIVAQFTIEGCANSDDAEQAMGRTLFANFVFTEQGAFLIKRLAKATGIELPTVVNKPVLEELATQLLEQKVGVVVKHRPDQNNEPRANIQSFFPYGSGSQAQAAAEAEADEHEARREEQRQKAAKAMEARGERSLRQAVQQNGTAHKGTANKAPTGKAGNKTQPRR